MSLLRRPTNRTRRPGRAPRRAPIAALLESLERRQVLSSGTTFLGLTAPQGDGTQHLVSFDSTALASATDLGAITGVTDGYTLDALAFDPSDGDLYGVAYSGSIFQFYQIDAQSRAATPLGYTHDWSATGVPPVGLAYSTDDNLYLYEAEDDPINSGMTFDNWYGFELDGNSYSGQYVSGPMPVAAAPTSTSGVLIGLDSSFNLVVSSDPTTWGVVGSLSPDFTADVGLEAAVDSDGNAFVAGTTSDGYHLYSVDTTTAATTDLGTLSQSLYGLVATGAPVQSPYFTVGGITGPVTAGASPSFRVTAYNGDGSIDTGFTGTVHFTSSDPNAVLPSDVALTNGVGSFSVTFKTAGSQSITATDVLDGSITGSESSISVVAGTATQFVITAPGTTQAGASQQFTVTAEDTYGNVVSGYSGTVAFTSTDVNAVLPLDTTLTDGTGTFSFQVSTARAETISAADTVTASIAGTSGSIDVTPGAVARVRFVGLSTTAMVGDTRTFTIHALDSFGNVATGDADALTLTTVDGSVTLPSSIAWVDGVATFDATFNGPGSPVLVVDDTAGPLVNPLEATATVNVGQIVQGTVYQDLTGSGVHAQGDPPMAGRVVYLDLNGTGQYDSDDPTTTTDADGHYSFPGYAAGSYQVRGLASQDADTRVFVSEITVASDGSLLAGIVPISPVAPVPVVPNPFGTTTASGFDSAYVQSLYRAVLGRQGANTEVTAWVQAMQGGMTTAQVAQGFVNSQEHRSDEVAFYDQHFLGQSPDGTATAWVDDLLGGMSEEGVVEGIIVSPAYQARYESDADYVTGLYANVLGRQPDASGQTFWTNVLTSGSMTRAQVAADFVGSVEAVDQAVASFYVEYLRRQPDATSSGWVSDLEGGGSASAVELGLLTSPEYASDVQALVTVQPGRALPSAVASPSWYTANLLDPSLATLVMQDMQKHGEVTRDDMLDLFSAVEADGTVTPDEYQDLRTIVGNTTVIAMSPSVRNLATKAVGSSAANAEYQGQALGDLAPGSPATQLEDLVNKWFLGLDLPTSDVAYASPSGALFGPGGSPGYTQIVQGKDGDCYFLSSLATLAQHDPHAIENLIVADGDGTYTVEFFAMIKGVYTPDYVTVDGELPENGSDFYYAKGTTTGAFADASNALWAPLMEKAFAQWTAEGYNAAAADTAGNSYDAIDSGYSEIALQELTGNASYAKTPIPSAAVDLGTLMATFDSGAGVDLGTPAGTPTDPDVVPDHDYAMVGYDATAGTITLFSPWGLAGGHLGAQFKPGLLTLTMAQIDQDYHQVSTILVTLT